MAAGPHHERVRMRACKPVLLSTQRACSHAPPVAAYVLPGLKQRVRVRARRPVLLGTSSGLVHEVTVDADRWAAKKEPQPPHQVLDLRDARKEVHAIEQVGLCGRALGGAGRCTLLHRWACVGVL